MDRKDLKILIVLVCCCLAWVSCTKDKPGKPDPVVPGSNSRKVLISCEGSLGNGNASLSVYFPVPDSIYQDVYTAANGKALGDVFQSIIRIGSRYFLCINNSDKIVVLDTASWQQRAEISLPKPRYILPVGNDKAYVSTLFSNKIYIINTATCTVTGTITMPYNNAEQLLLHNGAAYTCGWDTACSHIYRINTTTDQVADSILLTGRAPQSIITDKENKLWVMAGNPVKGKATTLQRIDAATKSILKSYAFATGVEAIKPVFNAAGDTLYFIEVNYSGGAVNNGIFRMRYNDAALPSAPLIPCSTFQYYWALATDPVSGNIYVGDPKGFVQNGEALIYNDKGALLRSFKTGLGPGSFYFD